jgi:hypothetical protein
LNIKGRGNSLPFFFRDIKVANVIKLKQSAVVGKIPLVTDLVSGEACVNTADGRVYIKRTLSGIESIVDVGNNAAIAALQSADTSLTTRVSSLETFKDEQTIYVAKNGNDATGNGGEHSPFGSLTAAMAAITDASATKRYIIKVKAGAYTAASALNLKANVFIVGEARDAVRISASSFGLDSSFSGSADNRSGMANVIVVSGNCDFNWATVTSAAGKLYFTDVSFSPSVAMYGHNNAIAQAQFHNCTFFSTFTVSGINVAIHRNNIHYGNITLNQHPNGGMVTTLAADGGVCTGTVSAVTTTNDFNRRCSIFARSFYMEYLTVNGASSYCDLTDNSLPRDIARVTKSNGGTLVYVNTNVPVETSTRNFGDVGRQYLYNFNYVNASTGSDLYVISMGTAFSADSAGRNIFVEADSYGLGANVNGGDINLTTATVSGTGVRGKIKFSAREIDADSAKVSNLADGVIDSDAVNKGQLAASVATLDGGLF